MNTVEDIKAAFEASGDASQAISAYTALLESSDDKRERENALIERGLLNWRQGDRAGAINDYNAAIRLNPDSKAVQLRKAVYSILDYYNKDLYNP